MNQKSIKYDEKAGPSSGPAFYAQFEYLKDDLPLITEKYYRGSSVKDKNGYGLGMYLVKLYMEKQGGGIEYYNNNGFTVELLIKKV